MVFIIGLDYSGSQNSIVIIFIRFNIFTTISFFLNQFIDFFSKSIGNFNLFASVHFEKV